MLWKYIRMCGEPQLTLTFDEIEKIAGLPPDRSFLKHKKELIACGWEVKKISMKTKSVLFVMTERE